MGDIDFEEQLELERLEKEKYEKLDADNHPREKVDEDGTVYEWDIEKKAWFPKIDANFIAQYQINYGAGNKEAEDDSAVNDVKQQQFLQSYYAATVQEEQYLSRKQKEAQKEDTHDEAMDRLHKLENDIKEGIQDDNQTDSKEAMEKYTEEEKQQYNEYWSYYYGTEYYDYYSDCLAAYSNEGEKDKTSAATAEEGKDGQKKGKKRKPVAPPREEGWFQVEQKDNTNVYVSGLPLDMKEQEFVEMMNKYGLIMFDPRTKKPKAKLYLDEQGQPKGDGRCCYIKRESVDLALNLLDGMELRGKTVKVEMATFNLKGEFDPSKKKKKLTNKEKKRMKERQQKLFDWRPDQPRFARGKHEKVVILKNVFDPKDFEADPSKINTVRNDVRTECSKYGEVKKTVVYDRHDDGVVSVHYKEAEEADLCIESTNHRFFAGRRIIAAQWDGQSKYEVEETEEERSKRLKQWEDFLESGGKGPPPNSRKAASTQDSEAASSQGIVAADTNNPVSGTHKSSDAIKKTDKELVDSETTSDGAREEKTEKEANNLDKKDVSDDGSDESVVKTEEADVSIAACTQADKTDVDDVSETTVSESDKGHDSTEGGESAGMEVGC